MTNVTLTEDDMCTILTALRVAAEQYDADAAALGTPNKTNASRLAAQFVKQASEARELSDRLEDLP
jgi:hypothetical protein